MKPYNDLPEPWELETPETDEEREERLESIPNDPPPQTWNA